MGKAIMAAAVLLGIGCTGATEVLSGGRTLFRSAGRVTYGAVYSGRAVKASVAAEAAGRVTMFAGREPVTVFLGGEALGRGAWEYDAAAESVTLSVPAGRSELQIRFDGLASLAPVRVSIPVSLVVEGTDRVVGAMAAEMADERLSGRFAWPGPEGFYDLEARLGEAAVPALAVR
ncbi:MAG: hypothetical protein JXR77_15310, partial [Lentisphaeria bacterium]|nr:hypothetical protein [Lentisphaeria bacterium]